MGPNLGCFGPRTELISLVSLYDVVAVIAKEDRTLACAVSAMNDQLCKSKDLP